MAESGTSRIHDELASRARRALLRAMVVALGAPLVSLAQQKIWRLGFLAARSRSTASNPDIYYDAFVQEMRSLGYVEDKNLVIEWRFADGNYNRLPGLAAELVRSNVDAIVTHGTPGVQAAKQATTTIPVVMAAVGDAVAAGLVTSLARPGGNITGLSFFQQELMSKRVELLKEVMPRANRIGYLMNLGNASAMGPTLRAMEDAAKALKIELQEFAVRGPKDFESAFSAMAKGRVDGLVISEESTMLANAKAIADLAARQRLPAVGGREFVEAGGVMGYGMNLVELYRRGAQIVDKVFKGAKPGEIPVEQPRVFELLINMKAAKALGIKIPQSILVRAEKVIE
ncbi:MAG TPA: ABC transporter substrate-binding protein [Burkholderiales bacterium]|nr:ABC transporter substrate-binding protein [Burkholderiales bacterium]